MLSQSRIGLFLTALLISNVIYANDEIFKVNFKDVKPSVLQKELGISKDLSMKFTAYQAEYGSPKSISDLKPNEYLSASDIVVLKEKFNLRLNYCNNNPLICKGNPIFVLPKEKLMELQKMQKMGNINK